jgi:hypothetical protein
MFQGSLNFCGLKFVVCNIRDIPGRSIVDSFAIDPEDQHLEEISGQYAVLDALVLINVVSSLACSELFFCFVVKKFMYSAHKILSFFAELKQMSTEDSICLLYHIQDFLQ